MKTCPQCHASLPDDASFCTACGTGFGAAPVQNQAAQQNPQPAQQLPYQQPDPSQQYQQPETQIDPYDHTDEFSEAEVHDNKIFALAVYALSFIGIIIALLAKSSDNSAYLRFHIKQQLMILIAEVMVAFITGVLCWTCIVPVAGCAALVFLEIVSIICFINVCRNKSVEPLLIRKLTFLK